MDQRSGDRRFIGRSKKSSCSIQGNTHFPNFELLDARIASTLNKIIQNSFFKRRSVPSRKTDRLNDIRLLLGYWRSWHRSRLCWLVYSCSSKRWYSGIRNEMWRNFTIDDKFHKMISWKVSTTWEYVSLINSKPFFELNNPEIHQKKATPDCQRSKTMVERSTENEDNGKKKFRAQFKITEFWSQKWMNWIFSRG